jgi:hypothetical protein
VTVGPPASEAVVQPHYGTKLGFAETVSDLQLLVYCTLQCRVKPGACYPRLRSCQPVKLWYSCPLEPTLWFGCKLSLYCLNRYKCRSHRGMGASSVCQVALMILL